MEKICFDSGMESFQLGDGGVLRFNPCDPNLYARFLEAVEKMKALEAEMVSQAKQLSDDHSGTDMVKLLQEVDQKMKQTLNWIFGEGTDFDQLLGGVNLLAVGANGERVVTNLFSALQPVLLSGAQACVNQQTRQAVARAKSRRGTK